MNMNPDQVRVFYYQVRIAYSDLNRYNTQLNTSTHTNTNIHTQLHPNTHELMHTHILTYTHTTQSTHNLYVYREIRRERKREIEIGRGSYTYNYTPHDTTTQKDEERITQEGGRRARRSSRATPVARWRKEQPDKGKGTTMGLWSAVEEMVDGVRSTASGE